MISLTDLALLAGTVASSNQAERQEEDIYCEAAADPPSPIAIGERSFFKGLLPFWLTKERGGGIDTSSSDSEETTSLKEVEASLAKEEEATKEKYRKLRRQRQSILDILRRKKIQRGT